MENNENIFENQPQQPSIPENPVFYTQPVEPAQPQPIPVQPVINTQPPVSPEAPVEKKKSGVVWKILLACGIALSLVIISCSVTAYYSSRYWVTQNSQLSAKFNTLAKEFKELEDFVDSNSYTGNGNSISGTTNSDPAKVYAQNKRSVVAISNQSSSTNIFGQVTQTASSGSGFIVSSDGYIVTNYHVIKGAKSLTAITYDETEYSATVVGYDDGNDFALLKVDAADLPAVTLGSSSALIEGDQVAAIGNPLGELTNTLTVGVISAKDRDVEFETSIINMLQTDAAINPGNSGGPLFNMRGEVVGITTAKISSEAVESLGFAIPIDDVKDMITQLIDKGYLSTPYMGVSINNSRDGVGVYVTGVEAGSPAATAGIRTGDLIVGVDDYETTTLNQLDLVLRSFKPGQTVSVFVYRNREVVELTLTFGEKQQAPTA